MHLIEDLGPGGAERLLVVNLSRLDRSSFDGVVCHLYDHRSLHWRQAIVELGYAVVSLGMTSVRDLPRGVIRLSRLLTRHRIDVLHTHLFGANLVGRMAAAVAGIPVVSSLHNPDYDPSVFVDNPSLSPRKLRILRWLDRATCRLARPEFVAVSSYVKESAKRHLGIPAERATIIYNSVDTAAFVRSAETTASAERLRAELGLAGNDPVVLCVARLDPQKGLRYLIEALPAIVREYPRVAALVVGGGAAAVKAGLVSLAERLQVRSHVHFLGPKADVRPYLELCDVFVLPSLYEGMGIALVEAMAMERPCVATRASAVPEVVADGVSGLLVPPANPAELAAAMCRLLADAGLRARMGAEGRRIACERFDVAQGIARLETLYRRVATATRA